MLIEGGLDQRVHVGGVHVEDATDLVVDVADAGQPADGRFGGGALAGVLHRAGQREVAVPGGRLDPFPYGGTSRERVVRRGGQHGVVTVVTWRQHHLQVVVHTGHPGDLPPGQP
jgi:hypothetical protein